MSLQIKGRVKMIGPTMQVSASFKKRELVVTTEEQYPQHIIIEFQQDKEDMLDGYVLNELVTVDINLRGREWVSPQGETRYFNTITGWRIAHAEGVGPAIQHQEQQRQNQPAPHHANNPTNTPPAGQAKPQQFDAFQPSQNFNEEEHDDLPF